MLSKHPLFGINNLEITMRDVLEGLEDVAIYMNYRSCPNMIEILSIEPAGRPTHNKYNIIDINQSLEENINNKNY